MSVVRGWRQSHEVEGPFPITPADIPRLNKLFSDAFTERYRKDGMLSVRVPGLNPRVWRYAIADAGRGAVLWRDREGEIAAFNLVHASGVEGWMGPLAVAPEHQGHGMGKMTVSSGVDWLKGRGARVIGLETMPRTMDNIGFYSSLGFVPGPLTITLTLAAALGVIKPALLGALHDSERDAALGQCLDLLNHLAPGYDFTREMQLTQELELGDTLLSYEGSELRAFALCHSAPLVEGRQNDELRVLKLAARDADSFESIVGQLAVYARKAGASTFSMRLQSGYTDAYRALLARGARVRWTDLRMTVAGYGETLPTSGIVLSNWEI